MAHYAYIDKETNIVITVTVGKDETELIDGLDTETYYAQGTPYTVKRTSYNSKIRKQYASVGDIYDVVNDVFISPQPYPSWSLDENFDWQPPTPRPQKGFWLWDEATLTWVEVELPTE
jgi:hypothetical protein